MLFLLVSLILMFGVASQAAACHLVQLRSVTKVSDRWVAQKGVGTVFKYRNQLYVLTASHVIHQAKTIKWHCESSSGIVKVVGESPTLDLAVLEINEKQSTLRPAFKFRPQTTLPSVTPMSQIFFPKEGAETKYDRIESASTLYQGESFSALALLGVQTALVLETAAARGGVSGSPVYDVKKKRPMGIPVGILTKSLANSHHSLAIPMQEIWPHILDLISGQDPWRKNSQRPYIAMKYKWNSRLKTVVWEKIIQSDVLSLTQLCHVDRARNVSQWHEVSGSDWIDDGGSDWVDDGGTSGRLEEYSGFPLDGRVFSVMRSHSFCTEDGLRMSNGRVLVGLREPRKTQRAAKIEDVFSLLVGLGPNAPSYLERNGEFKKNHRYLSFCSDWMGPTLEMGFSKSKQITGWLSNAQSYVYSFSSVDRSVEGATRIRCDREGKKYFDVNFDVSDESIQGNLRIYPEKISGEIKLGQCRISLSKSDVQKSFWSAKLTHKNADVLFSWRPDKAQKFQVHVTRISEHCGNTDRLWLYTLSMVTDMPWTMHAKRKTNRHWSLKRGDCYDFRINAKGQLICVNWNTLPPPERIQANVSATTEIFATKSAKQFSFSSDRIRTSGNWSFQFKKNHEASNVELSNRSVSLRFQVLRKGHQIFLQVEGLSTHKSYRGHFLRGGVNSQNAEFRLEPEEQTRLVNDLSAVQLVSIMQELSTRLPEHAFKKVAERNFFNSVRVIFRGKKMVLTIDGHKIWSAWDAFVARQL